MSLTQALIAEIKHESVSTQKILECIPNDRMDWAPHSKSMTIKELASHIASLSGWAGIIATTSELDLAGLETSEINNNEDLVKELQKGTQSSIEALKSVKDEDLNALWTLRMGDQILLEMPKAAFIRFMAQNHLVHHRGQLSVYLRLLDVPIPGMYGPSADDKA